MYARFYRSGWLRGYNKSKQLPLTNPEICRNRFEALTALLFAYRFVDVIQYRLRNLERFLDL